MQKKLNNNRIQLPQMNVSRVGRKVFFTGEVNEDSMHELLRTLAEIEWEDEEQQPQDKVEVLINDFMNSVDLLKCKKQDKKSIYNELDDSINTYNNDNSLNRLPIQLYINSFGGNIYEALNFIDVVRLMKTPVHTIASGKCMSAGALMLMAGDRRFATLNSTILIHQMSSGTYGNFQTMLEDMAEFQRLQDLVNDLIMTYTNVDEELLQEIQESKYDYYMDVEEALDLGIIDEIL